MSNRNILMCFVLFISGILCIMSCHKTVPEVTMIEETEQPVEGTQAEVLPIDNIFEELASAITVAVEPELPVSAKLNIATQDFINNENDGKTTFLNESIRFQLPSGFVFEAQSEYPINISYDRFKLRISSSEISELYEYLDEGYILSQSVTKLLINTKSIATENLQNLYVQGNKYVLGKFTPWSDFEESWQLVTKNDVPIGEASFVSTHDGLLAGPGFSYHIYLILQDKIVSIVYSYLDTPDYELIQEMPLYSVETDGYFYWQTEEKLLDFYHHLSGAEYKTLPMQLQQLREGWDSILATLEVK